MEKIIVITGHYGAGKTTYAINLALSCAKTGMPVTIVDLDIVNPYFRTADFGKLMQHSGITLIAPEYANSNVDIPVLNFDLEYLAAAEGYLIIDVGGDDAGATALGRYADALVAYGDKLELRYVINRYRYLTQTAEEAFAILQEIEAASRLRHTGIVNNSNLGCETTAETITDSLPYAQALAAQAKLPLLHTVRPEAIPLEGDSYFPVQLCVQPVWGTSV